MIPVNIDSSLVQKYAPVLASALVLILPAVDILAKNPSPIAVLQFLALLVTTGTTLRLAAPWKQVAEWVGVVVAAVLPLALSGDITWANWAFVAVAVVKAAAVHLGVAIRRDPEIDVRNTPAGAVPVITSVPASAMPGGDRLVVDDNLGVDLAAAAPSSSSTPGPDHRADAE